MEKRSRCCLCCPVALFVVLLLMTGYIPIHGQRDSWTSRSAAVNKTEIVASVSTNITTDKEEDSVERIRFHQMQTMIMLSDNQGQEARTDGAMTVRKDQSHDRTTGLASTTTEGRMSSLRSREPHDASIVIIEAADEPNDTTGELAPDQIIPRKLNFRNGDRKPAKHTRNCRCPYPGENLLLPRETKI